ncbi:hypothetical protein [Sporosarcina koreensis]|uniref:hypothetical protein n=1 Tax=Sporosarcina koreensis TaxID=334735 RepID=UPI00058DAA77|nr:hypothetical protein [Sporosarcina koreensis]
MKDMLTTVEGCLLKTIVCGNLTAVQLDGGWLYRMAGPVLQFERTNQDETMTFWKLDSQETEEGDDILQLTATADIEEVPYLEWSSDFNSLPVTGSSIQPDQADSETVTGYGFHHQGDGCLTAVGLKVSGGVIVMKAEAGGLVTVLFTDEIPDDLGSELEIKHA